MHQNDELIAKKMLGGHVVPDDIAEELTIRERMLHIGGGSGGIGVLGVAEAIRFCGHMPVAAAPPPEKIDWREYPIPTAVEVKMFGDWVPGKFMGFCTSGMLTICLDSEPGINKEIVPGIVRLAGEEREAAEAKGWKPPPDWSGDEFFNENQQAEWESLEKGTLLRITEAGETKSALFEEFRMDSEFPSAKVTVDGEEESRWVPCIRLDIPE